MDLTCRLTSVGDHPVLVVDGEVDMGTVPRLRDQLMRAVGRHRGETLLVDLDAISVLDDTGLGVLLGAAGSARSTGGEIVLVCSAPALLERFAITGLDRAITVQARLAT